MSRKRTLYLSEMILRLSHMNTLDSITIQCEQLCVIWTYKNKEQALKDLQNREVLWNRQVNYYTIIDNRIQIVLK